MNTGCKACKYLMLVFSVVNYIFSIKEKKKLIYCTYLGTHHYYYYCIILSVVLPTYYIFTQKLYETLLFLDYHCHNPILNCVLTKPWEEIHKIKFYMIGSDCILPMELRENRPNIGKFIIFSPMWCRV